MKIVGQQGDRVFLVALSEDRDGEARVLDLDAGVFYRAARLQLILGQGYWEPYTGSQDRLDDLLKRVTAQP